jgi:DNA-binding transcriptional LysR family regulator
MEGRLAIGCVGSATYSLLPQLVRALHEELPGVDVSIRGEMLAPAQVAALLSGEIDLALLRPPVDHSQLSVQTVRHDRLRVALPQGHPLTSRRELRVADLRDEEFVAHAGHGRSMMSNVLTAACAEAGFVPRVRHEVEETSTLVTLVAAGLGVAVVPDPTASLNLPGVCYRPLVPDRLGIDLVAAHPVQANAHLIARVLTILRHVARVESVPR